MSTAPTIDRLLVPLDGSPLAEQAIPYAAAIARSEGTIVFLQVLPATEPVRDLLGTIAVSSTEMRDLAADEATAALRETATKWQVVLPGTPAIEIASGDPATEIARAAERLGCGLIVAASHGRGAIGRLAFGSVADALARSATVAVLLVRPRDAHAEIELPRFGRVVVPYDGSELAAEAFPLAQALAARLGTAIHLIWAVSPIVAMPMPSPVEPPYPSELLEATLDDSEDAAKAELASARETLTAAGATVTTEVVMGSPFDAIVARSEPDDLIVLASHRRGGLARWLIGSVAERLVREAPAPVVVAHAGDGAWVMGDDPHP